MASTSHIIAEKLIFSAALLAGISNSVAADLASSPSDDSASCDKGWTFSDGFCYYFSEANDSRPFFGAMEECLLLDAEFVWPENLQELVFLQKQAKIRNVYGWALNVQYTKSYRGSKREDKFVYFNLRNHVYETITTDTGNIPTIQKTFNSTDMCVSLHIGKSLYRTPWYRSKTIEISSEACSLRLWVVCQGKESDFPNQLIDYIEWFRGSERLYWFGGKIATQAKAVALCRSENMELVTDLDDLIISINGTYDATPWWTGLKFTEKGLQKHDQTFVDFEGLRWVSSDIRTGTVYLHHSGYARLAVKMFGYPPPALPYLCKKRAFAHNPLGCPAFWFRGGKSCYFLNQYDNMGWEEAKAFCEKQKAHLLTVNSLNEKLWIETAVPKMLHDPSKPVWTSANDLDNEGTFFWHDGSPMVNGSLPWYKNPFRSQSEAFEKCSKYVPATRYLSSVDCNNNRYTYPACQYTLPDAEKSCLNKWDKLGSTCYYFETKDYLDSYSAVLPFCASKARETESKNVHPLLLPTGEIVNFTYQLARGRRLHTSFWLGMTQSDIYGIWEWDDSTQVDFSVFDMKKEPNNGYGMRPENCVVLLSSRSAADKQCSLNYPFMCEKELPVSALDGGGVADLRAMVIVHVFSFIVGFMVNANI